MTTGVTLKKGKLSDALHKTLIKYYKNTGIGTGFIEIKWQRWANSNDIIVFTARKGNEFTGWIVYNRMKSAVEDIAVKDRQTL